MATDALTNASGLSEKRTIKRKRKGEGEEGREGRTEGGREGKKEGETGQREREGPPICTAPGTPR